VRRVTDPRTEIVRAGYDAAADRFAEWGARVVGDPRALFLSAFIEALPASGSVLELGCGGGAASTVALAERFDLTAVDVSAEQIARARATVQGPFFIEADMLDLDFPPASFHGVVALYSISHVPRDRHSTLFASIARWLRPGGVFMASLGAGDVPDWTGEWLGVPMFFSSFDADTNQGLLGAAGLAAERAEVVSMHEPEGEVEFLWVLCRTRASR
jgi:SAM-dependent methyltransferase